MTVERYFGVLHPLKHRTLITKKRIVVFHACGTSFMLTIVALCTVRIDLLGTFYSMSLLIFLFVAVFVYTKIFLTIRKRERPGNAVDLNNSAERSVSYRQSKRNFLKQIRLVKSCFLAVAYFVFFFLRGILAALPHGLDKFKAEILNLWEARRCSCLIQASIQYFSGPGLYWETKVGKLSKISVSEWIYITFLMIWYWNS